MSETRTSLVGLRTEALEQLAVECGERPFRGRQLAKWLYKDFVSSLDEARDLPTAFKARLLETHVVDPIQIELHKHSSDDVDKLLVHKGDGQLYECVLLPYKGHVSCCLSSQVGCPMGCTFCATGLGGFERNLSSAEIVGQYVLLQRLSPRRISHIVFMGMGEPLLNLDSLVEAIEKFHHEIGLSYRHITVSTVGLLPQIQKLSSLGLPLHLALSLHSPFDEVRSRLMPVNQRWPVQEIVATVKEYGRSTGRKVTYEYLLINGVNDSVEQAEALAELVRGPACVVNLIPFNYVDTKLGFSRPTRQRVSAFRSVLERRKVNVTERVERGHDIAAACGQLAGQHSGKFALRQAGGAI